MTVVFPDGDRAKTAHLPGDRSAFGRTAGGGEYPACGGGHPPLTPGGGAPSLPGPHRSSERLSPHSGRVGVFCLTGPGRRILHRNTILPLTCRNDLFGRRRAVLWAGAASSDPARSAPLCSEPGRWG